MPPRVTVLPDVPECYDGRDEEKIDFVDLKKSTRRCSKTTTELIARKVSNQLTNCARYELELSNIGDGKKQKSEHSVYSNLQDIDNGLQHLRLQSISVYQSETIECSSDEHQQQQSKDIQIQCSDFISLETNRTRNGVDQNEQDDVPAWCHIMETDSEGDSMLFIAIIAEMTDIAVVMIDLIPDYNLLSTKNNMFQSALHLAALTDNHVVSRRLVVAGARIDQQDQNGNTPLHIACMRGNYNVAEVLLNPVQYSEMLQNSYEIPYQRLPQNLNIRNYKGQDCLTLAAVHNHKHIIDLLLEKGADINSKDLKTGKTPLHIATEAGDMLLTEFLCSKYGVDLNARTYAGYTPVELAYYRGHYTLAETVLSRGAEYPRILEEIEDEHVHEDNMAE